MQAFHILFGTLITLLSIRTDVETTILRTPGMIFQKQSETKYSNIYNVILVNKTFDEIPITFDVVEPKGQIKWVGEGIENLAAQDVAKGEFFLIIDKKDILSAKTVININILSNGKIIDNITTNFIGPTN
jgi:hypothetical protein